MLSLLLTLWSGYFVFTITKQGIKTGVSNHFDKRKKLKDKIFEKKIEAKIAKYELKMETKNGKKLVTKESFNRIEEVLKFCKKYAKDNIFEKIKAETIQDGEVVEKKEVTEQEAINLLEKANPDEVVSKSDIEEFKDELMRIAYSNGQFQDVMQKDLKLNEEIAINLDKVIKEKMAKTKAKAKISQPNFLGSKNDTEALAGYYQNLIKDKIQILEELDPLDISWTKNINPEFYDQVEYSSEGITKQRIYNFLVNKKPIKIISQPNRLHLKKTPRVMNERELNEWTLKMATKREKVLESFIKQGISLKNENLLKFLVSDRQKEMNNEQPNEKTDSYKKQSLDVANSKNKTKSYNKDRELWMG